MHNVSAIGWGAFIGVLGGLIGLGGAEFRLPVLVGVFRYRTLQAIVINLVVSLVTVFFSFIFRTGLVNLDRIIAHAPIVLNLLAGTLIGASLGVRLATRISEENLKRMVVVLLVMLSAVLIGHEFILQGQGLALPFLLRTILGFVAGVVIGVVSSMLGVAGGELIIPTIILLFGVDIKLAGSLSLAISLPTIMVGLARYRAQPVFQEVRSEVNFIRWMAVGSIVGALVGSYLLRYTPGAVLHVLLGCILLVSALKLSRTKHTA